MPKIIKVAMGDSKFTSSNKIVLVTEGICTCIAFVIYASFWNEDDEIERVRGLYHWPGFSVGSNQQHETQGVFINFLEELRETYTISEKQEIKIERLDFIGGEKAEWENDELILSGTEAEVINLKTVVEQFNFSDHYFNIAPEQIYHHHFLTSGNQSITVSLSSNEYKFIIEEDSCDEDYSSSGLAP